MHKQQLYRSHVYQSRGPFNSREGIGTISSLEKSCDLEGVEPQMMCSLLLESDP
jgi:hypothetical protein